MQPARDEKLIRKQYLLSSGNVKKLQQLAGEQGKSAAEIVRLAIDAYDPDAINDMGQDELMALVSARIKEAIKDTQNTRKRLNQTLKKFGAENK